MANKIITCPDQCGFCDRSDNYRDTHCKHPKSHYLQCLDPNKFPHACPLDDAPTLNMAQTKALLRHYLPNILADDITEEIFLGTGKSVKK